MKQSESNSDKKRSGQSGKNNLNRYERKPVRQGRTGHSKKNAGLKKREMIISCLLFLFLMAAASIYLFFFKADSKGTNGTGSKPLSIEFLDVGQGDCILLSCDGKNMLIDAGDNNMGTTVQLALEKRNVTYLDYVIGTHAHADHIGGLDVIITKFDCDKIILSPKRSDTKTCDDVYNAIKYRNYKVTEAKVGDTYELGDAVFTILSPGENNYGDDLNNYSVSILVEHGSKKFLFTGDSEAESEQDMINTGLLKEVDVFKAGHHGSSTSNSELLLDTIFSDSSKPHYAVISCGEDNSYGHPHSETLNNFRSRKISVFRTDEQGTIKIVSENGILRFNCSPTETWQSGERR